MSFLISAQCAFFVVICSNFEIAELNILYFLTTRIKVEKMSPNKVFIVHGRNHVALDEVKKFLGALKLVAITWKDAVQLTMKSAPTTLEVVKAGIDEAQAVIVLMTGDDEARLRPDYANESLMPQPRPNVFFEAGWALAIAGQERTIFLRFGGLRELSDINGVSMLEIDNSPPKRTELLARLRIAGCSAKKNNNTYLVTPQAGDFDLQREPDEPTQNVLQRGGFTEFVVDSSLSHSLSLLDLEKDVIHYLFNNDSPELKFNYLGAVGAQNWINLCDDANYGRSEVEDATKGNATEIIAATQLAGCPMDFISLGPGDGALDMKLLLAFGRYGALIANYYPFDISIELLQRAVARIVKSPPCQKLNFKIKAIHGDFSHLTRYKTIYAYDPAVNFFSLIGYTLGNHNEATLLGKIKEGMNSGDFLLLDARLHNEGQFTNGRKMTREQAAQLEIGFSHALNNRFAFGPLELVTTADFGSTNFKHEVKKSVTVPNSISVTTFIENVATKIRSSGRKLQSKRINLAITKFYDESSLADWLIDDGLEVVWKRKEKNTAIFLLRKPK